MSIFEKAIQAITKTGSSFKNFAKESEKAENTVRHFSSAYPWHRISTLKRFVFEYQIAHTSTNGEVSYSPKQKEIMAKSLQGAIRKLYLEAEPGFTGLKKILWEDK